MELSNCKSNVKTPKGPYSSEEKKQGHEKFQLLKDQQKNFVERPQICFHPFFFRESLHLAKSDEIGASICQVNILIRQHKFRGLCSLRFSCIFNSIFKWDMLCSPVSRIINFQEFEQKGKYILVVPEASSSWKTLCCSELANSLSIINSRVI